MRPFLTWRWILSHLFVILMLVLMVNLGFWQLRRLDWRKASNVEIRLAMSAQPVDLGALLDSSVPPMEYTQVSASGSFDVEHEFLIANRTFESQAGSWLVTPLDLDDGRVVAVVRGWVPRLWVAGSDLRDASAPTGRVSVEGLAFASINGGKVADDTVHGVPELNRMDARRFDEVTGLDFESTWVRLQTQDPPLGDLPVPVPVRPLDEGPHLSYAIQWFLFSAGTVIVYYLILTRRKRELDSGI